jgi:hypothetical protein
VISTARALSAICPPVWCNLHLAAPGTPDTHAEDTGAADYAARGVSATLQLTATRMLDSGVVSLTYVQLAQSPVT